jgi:hypothetical protein
VGKTQPLPTDEKFDLYSAGNGKLGLGSDRIKAAIVGDQSGWALGQDGLEHVRRGRGQGQTHTGQRERDCVRV